MSASKQLEAELDEEEMLEQSKNDMMKGLADEESGESTCTNLQIEISGQVGLTGLTWGEMFQHR